MTDDMARLEWLAGRLVDEHDGLLAKLIAQRKKHSLTQAEVAERMGVSQPTVAAFEHYDANPTLASVRRYALAVGAGIEHTVTDECAVAEDSLEAIARTFMTANWSKPTRALGWHPTSPAPVRIAAGVSTYAAV